MTPRLNVQNDAPDGYKALLGLEKFMSASSLPSTTYHLIKLRASQINGCAFCVDMHAHDLHATGETLERIFAVAAWREAPFFTDAERAALALTEAATRMADTADPVPDQIWDAAAEHFDQQTLAALVMGIAAINAWNRICVITRTVAGSHRA